MAIFSAAAAEGRRATIFGDGSQTRDYIYVGDVVAAFLAAGRSDAQSVLNISTGSETSLSDLLARLGVDADHAPGRSGEVRRSCLDPRSAERVLGWRARTTLDDGLRRTLEGLR